MLKIWGRKNSANVQKVLWLAGELDLPYEHIPAGGSFGRTDEPAFRALNPNGRVPVIQDGDLTLWESQAILRYLAARYGTPQFWPTEASARALNDQWMDWSQSTFQSTFLNGVFWGFYRTPEAQRNWPAIQKSLADCSNQLALLDRVLARQPFLSGPDLSLGDIPAGAMMYRYYELEIERPRHANVEAWYARLKQRPAYRDTVMVPFDDLKGRLSF